MYWLSKQWMCLGNRCNRHARNDNIAVASGVLCAVQQTDAWRNCYTESGLKEILYIRVLYIHPWTVSNTDNVNILCKYLMYKLTDCRLILTKSDPISRQRGRYKITNLQLSKENLKEKKKIGRWSQMGAWHQDRLADWLSVAMWPWLWCDNKKGAIGGGVLFAVHTGAM
jgi:hypothetical protein